MLYLPLMVFVPKPITRSLCAANYPWYEMLPFAPQSHYVAYLGKVVSELVAEVFPKSIFTFLF